MEINILKIMDKIIIYSIAVALIKSDYPKHKYLPANVLYKNSEYYHIYYHDSWVCRWCMHVHGEVIMPLIESDRIYFRNWKEVNILEIFKKRKCKKCGEWLQGHLIFLD